MDHLEQALHRELAAAETPAQRAAIVYRMTRAAYEWVKVNVSGGGLDGRDSEERAVLATVVEAASDYEEWAV